MTTNNDHAAALELWEAMGAVDGLRPSCIELTPDDYYEMTRYRFCYFIVMNVTHVNIEDEHALHILTGHAERWLRERGWLSGDLWETYWHPVSAHAKLFDSLAAAIRAELGRGK